MKVRSFSLRTYHLFGCNLNNAGIEFGGKKSAVTKELLSLMDYDGVVLMDDDSNYLMVRG